MQVAVLGGGINGFCCAIQVKEKWPGAKVSIISDLYTPNTTGDGSAGLWGPYLMGDTPAGKVNEWSLGMHKFLKQIWISGDSGEAGVCLIPCVRLATGGNQLDVSWRDIVYGCRAMKQTELDAYSGTRSSKFTSGLHFVTYTSEPAKLLPYLEKRFRSSGGNVIKQKINDLEELIRNSNYDVFVNCVGLGALDLVNDKMVHSIRGQVSRVKADWIYYAILDESFNGNYIIPNLDSVVLGGTHQENNYNLNICPNDKSFIINGCQIHLPGLKHAQHLKDWVGLRPGRKQVRLEMEKTYNNKILIHNYGHGGCGVTLSWGCASEVVELLQKSMKSKL
ncbi:D-aspartate oxidase isoform X2 [Eupeodes corollae]|uniref:D-aspartate oxidase isoform X2 n=1 Tax=Eupeodes corollae TaxID=290404 RepID=UPI00249230E9|nr:D-aspartate oxidase isoform X2 [Eupeodes corollae]